MYVCTYLPMYLCTYVGVCVCVYVGVCVCVCVWVTCLWASRNVVLLRPLLLQLDEGLGHVNSARSDLLGKESEVVKQARL